jgi:hypothetical protein
MLTRIPAGTTSLIQKVFLANASGRPVVGLGPLSNTLPAPTVTATAYSISNVRSATWNIAYSYLTVPGNNAASGQTLLSSPATVTGSGLLVVTLPEASFKQSHVNVWMKENTAPNYFFVGQFAWNAVTVNIYRESTTVATVPATNTSFANGLKFVYRRNNGSLVSVQPRTHTLGVYTSGGITEIDAVNQPGWYEVCVPDAALAIGAEYVDICIESTGNVSPLKWTIELTSDVFCRGTATGSPSTTSVTLSGNLSSVNNAYVDQFLMATSGGLIGSVNRIVNYDASTKTFTLVGFPVSPTVGDEFVVIGKK